MNRIIAAVLLEKTHARVSPGRGNITLDGYLVERVHSYVWHQSTGSAIGYYALIERKAHDIILLPRPTPAVFTRRFEATPPGQCPVETQAESRAMSNHPSPSTRSSRARATSRAWRARSPRRPRSQKSLPARCSLRPRSRPPTEMTTSYPPNQEAIRTAIPRRTLSGLAAAIVAPPASMALPQAQKSRSRSGEAVLPELRFEHQALQQKVARVRNLNSPVPE